LAGIGIGIGTLDLFPSGFLIFKVVDGLEWMKMQMMVEKGNKQIHLCLSLSPLLSPDTSLV